MGFPWPVLRLLGGSAIIAFLSTLTLDATTLLPPGFTATEYGATLGGSAAAMEFAPDGRLFICLKEGIVRIINTNGILLAVPFMVIPVDPYGERGLVGIAFDPDFASNHFVYFYHTVPGSPPHNRVSHFTADGDVAVPGSEVVILDLDNLSDLNHNGGGIHFGADGKLYVGVGENGNVANSQSLENRLGKMLRINSDGSIPSDNPTTFPGISGSTSGANRAIWAVGLRNPFTFAIQPGTGRIFINDVGDMVQEEINDGIAGSNYGWNLCEGFCPTPSPNYRDPLFEYGHGGTPVSGCAIVGGAFYNPPVNQFPSSYVGKYFFEDLCVGWIRLFNPADNTATDFAQFLRSPVDLKVGSDGSLYCLTRGNSGQVFRIQYAPPPTPTPAPAQSLNMSTRLHVGTGDDLMIGGFIVAGPGPKTMLLRGLGPSLAGAGVPPNDVLLDPVLELRGPSILPFQNDNWRDGPFGSVIKGTIFQPNDDHEALILTQLQAGSYTALLTGKNETTGVGLMEVYDYDQSASTQLANVSARGFVGTQENVIIGGFILSAGGSSTHVAIRGIGPTLTQVGVSNALSDPLLVLRDSNGTILVANDNWQDDALSASELAFLQLGLRDFRESGIYTVLPPGSFTASLSGKINETGVGLLELYNVQ